MRTKSFILMAVVALAATTQSCKTDPAVDEPITSASILTSKLVTTAPTMDGVIDASWEDCDKLSSTAAIPDTAMFSPLYKLFFGETNNFTIRSMHDATNIYFLVELADLTKSVDQKSWYFDPALKLWKQPSSNVIATATGSDKFGEDKFGFIFPVNENGNWNKKTCFATCHANPAVKSDPNNLIHDHFTDSTTFAADLWHWRSVQSQPSGQLQDGYVTVKQVSATAAGGFSGGRLSDATTAYPLSSSNKQNLVPTGGTIAISVPWYVLVTPTGLPAIRQIDIDNGAAKKVTAVDTNGKLTLENGTIIDPTTSTDYAYKTGTKRLISVINRGVITGSKGDVMTYANYVDGKGWVIEVVRALHTADTQWDVQFDVTKEYMFGFAVFDNGNGEHAIKTQLKLKF